MEDLPDLEPGPGANIAPDEMDIEDCRDEPVEMAVSELSDNDLNEVLSKDLTGTQHLWYVKG